MNYNYDSNNLQHAGVKGMKWGIRRYQNKDGSLTPAGKKRYGDDSSNDNEPDSKDQKTKIQMTNPRIR